MKLNQLNCAFTVHLNQNQIPIIEEEEKKEEEASSTGHATAINTFTDANTMMNKIEIYVWMKNVMRVGVLTPCLIHETSLKQKFDNDTQNYR